MSRYARIATTGQVQAGEAEAIWRPVSSSDGAGKRGVLLVHGAGATYTEFTDANLAGSLETGHLLASMGFYVLTADFGGTNTLGNDTATARILAGWNLLKTLGCQQDKAIGVGVSMGTLNLLNTARAGGVPFSLIAGLIPLADLDDFRDQNRGGARNNVNTAWGLPANSTSATNPLPARANPNTSTNAALIAAACPSVYLTYSSGDTITPPATVTSLAAKLTTAGASVTTVIHSALEHSEASVLAAVQRSEFVAALLAADA